MTSRLDFRAFVDALRAAGLEAGETVHVQSSLPHIGPVDRGDRAADVLNFYLDGFREVLGSAGTILVHTPFEDYGRYAVPFIVEESPSRAGVFSEFIRTQPGAVRSMHPIASTAGIGPAAAPICDGPHFEAFGYMSSWGRMHRANVRFMTLGLTLRGGLSFAHYCESQYGVPYQYCKVYDTPVYKAGRRVPGVFTMRVRYLDFSIAVDIIRYQERLRALSALREAPCGRSLIHAVSAHDAFDVGMELLSEDPYAMLREPPAFRAGVIPFDGPTGPARYSYDLASGDGRESFQGPPPKGGPVNFDRLRKSDERTSGTGESD